MSFGRTRKTAPVPPPYQTDGRRHDGPRAVIESCCSAPATREPKTLRLGNTGCRAFGDDGGKPVLPLRSPRSRGVPNVQALPLSDEGLSEARPNDNAVHEEPRPLSPSERQLLDRLYPVNPAPCEGCVQEVVGEPDRFTQYDDEWVWSKLGDDALSHQW